MSNASNMFEIATRSKLRFASPRGDLTAEQLWDVPLRSRDDFNLDGIAKAASKALKAVTEESFVDTRANPQQGRMELTLDIVKYVIQTKITEENETTKRADRKAEREKLMAALSKKQDDALDQMSEKDIKKRLEALSD
jgi:hypothetical protein